MLKDAATGSSPRLRLWALLVAAAALGFLGATPLLAEVVRAALLKAGKTFPLPLALLAQGVQVTLLSALAAWAGVVLAPRASLDAPYFRALATGTSSGRDLKRDALFAILAGSAATALTVLAIEALKPWVPEQLHAQATPTSRLVGASGAFYGGIVEELMMRWGVLTALVALARKAGLRDGFWPANILAALVFGLGHLPAARALGIPITVPTLAYVLLGNGICGLAFGWVFRQRGLENAMLAHATADIWLHAVLRP